MRRRLNVVVDMAGATAAPDALGGEGSAVGGAAPSAVTPQRSRWGGHGVTAGGAGGGGGREWWLDPVAAAGGGGGAAGGEAGGAPPPPALPRVLRMVGRGACWDGWQGTWGEAWKGGWKSMDGPP